MSSKALFNVPSGATATVKIIDSTLRLSKLPSDYLMTPSVEGFSHMPTFTTWSFLIESASGQKALFDLGVPPDIETHSPAIIKRIKNSGWDVRAEKHVADILSENGVRLAEINSVIWSHWHWDHIGDPSTFPESTELVVGPGFKDAFYPGYPTKPDAPVRERDFSGRTLREIDFDAAPLQVGEFRALDFFGDGSFYLLDTPGHAVGHLAGLARTTTSPDSFILMGGDLCHHGGEMRPTSHLPIPPKVEFPLSDALRARFSVCPGGELFEQLNVKRGRKADEPFFDPAIGLDVRQAIQTIKEAQLADAQDNVFFIFAHDNSIFGVVDLFPLTANAWMEKGWREATLWKFLADLMPGLKNG